MKFEEKQKEGEENKCESERGTKRNPTSAVDEFTRVFSQIMQLKIVLYIYTYIHIYDIILDRIDYNSERTDL